MTKIEVIPIKTVLLRRDPYSQIISTMESLKIKPLDGDIFVISSKIVSLQESRVVELIGISPQLEAKKLARKYKLSPEFCQLVIDEADEISGGTHRAILTLKNGIYIANAGIDQSNMPAGFVSLWPKNPTQSAQTLKNLLKQKFQINLGVVIADSHCQPLRRGTTALAIAIVGFEGWGDKRGHKDLFGRTLRITTHSLADNIASCANMVMGEADERIPVVIIRGLRIILSDESATDLTQKLLINPKEDLFSNLYHKRGVK